MSSEEEPIQNENVNKLDTWDSFSSFALTILSILRAVGDRGGAINGRQGCMDNKKTPHSTSLQSAQCPQKCITWGPFRPGCVSNLNCKFAYIH